MNSKNKDKIDDTVHYLYRITCLVNNKVYIGQSIDPGSRWREHQKDSTEPKLPIHLAMNKYGIHNFNMEVIATCKSFDSANYLETFLVTQYNSYVANDKGYNATLGGFNAPRSEEFKKALSKRMSGENNPFYGKKNPPEIIERGRQAHLGKKISEEHKAKISAAQKGIKRGPQKNKSTARPWNKVDWPEEEIIEDRKNGMLYPELKEKYNIHMGTLSKLLNKHGLGQGFIKRVPWNKKNK